MPARKAVRFRTLKTRWRTSKTRPAQEESVRFSGSKSIGQSGIGPRNAKESCRCFLKCFGDVMEKLFWDVKMATRSLARSKGYGFAVVFTLSACIAVNVAIFAIVNSVLLRPLPVPNAQQIVLMSNRYPKAGVPDQYISSSGDYYDRLKYVTALQDQA